MRNIPKNTEETRSGQEEAGFPLPLWREGGETGVVWSIAGFDPSSGAGITADLMTFAAHGLFGCSAITALTVQSTIGVFGWEAVSPQLLRNTMDRLWGDLPPLGIKLGMLGTAENAAVIGSFLAEEIKGQEPRAVVVFDPVLRSSSGKDLYPAEQVTALHQKLLPVVDWITPNWAEMELLAGQTVRDLQSAEAAAHDLCKRHRQLNVVVTGGDQEQPTDLLVRADGSVVAFEGRRIATAGTHGTGCAFSSALLAEVVLGFEPTEAVRRAKAYVESALQHAPGIGQGRGPMGLLWPLLPGGIRARRDVATLDR